MANQSLTLNITLEAGAVMETVNVSGAAVQVNTTTSTLGDVVDHARIVDLVLNGRDIAKLAALVPGMQVISVSPESGKSIPGGLQLSSNGTRNQQILYRLDAASNTDSYFQENQTFPFPDAVQEFSIQTSNYVDTSPNRSDFAERVLREATRRNFTQASRCAVLGDGSTWIWNTTRELFPQATQILDGYHAKEALHRTAQSISGATSESKQWATARCTELDDGKLHDIVRGTDLLC